ncbi:MAG: M48 family metallopeptidase [Halapricum sp.]
MLVSHLVFVVLLVGTEAFFTVLDVLNLRHGERTVAERAEWVADVLGVDDTDALRDYNRASTGLSRLQSVVSLGFVLLVLYSGLFADAVEAVQSLGLPALAEGVVFLVGAVVALQVVSWPFDVVDTFVVEELFDFNEQSPRLWVRDALVQLVVTAVVVGVLAAALLAVIRTVPDLWALGGAGLTLVFSVAMLVVYPRVIAPLFNNFDPVEEGELREAVDDVFERAGFTCEQVYEMDASRRSSHSNAYFVGFGRTKRVVLFDTLVEQMGLEEVESVLAHELAHWKKYHVWLLVGAQTVQVAVLLGVVQFLMGQPWLYEMFGVEGTTYAGLALAIVWVVPLNQLLQPASNRLSLAAEREADTFAVEVMGDAEPLQDALANLVGENLANPFPHPLYATFHYTHPPVPDRIRYLEEMAEESGEGAAATAG